ncbi:hypothetical protein BABINDRAFT_159169 [Babjeviella inositovora NRRL Y-12698]|uniref:Uncharacterized protein n=1 Tax=Babjeviella inositovora NRRL Y-12698 TaxID=984486 RepID=A0A1E3QYD2_9ASCO|nr:uncharacterized protein BABINDRAFT_159169 [Babjeviella inositovora NRRL Y-12698]ODQ82616.1 hypothetical protein BABINDRAFT_159169 [Babjeviella inositovora NRRL Y-12698]
MGLNRYLFVIGTFLQILYTGHIGMAKPIIPGQDMYYGSLEKSSECGTRIQATEIELMWQVVPGLEGYTSQVCFR